MRLHSQRINHAANPHDSCFEHHTGHVLDRLTVRERKIHTALSCWVWTIWCHLGSDIHPTFTTPRGGETLQIRGRPILIEWQRAALALASTRRYASGFGIFRTDPNVVLGTNHECKDRVCSRVCVPNVRISLKAGLSEPTRANGFIFKFRTVPLVFFRAFDRLTEESTHSIELLNMDHMVPQLEGVRIHPTFSGSRRQRDLGT